MKLLKPLAVIGVLVAGLVMWRRKTAREAELELWATATETGVN